MKQTVKASPTSAAKHCRIKKHIFFGLSALYLLQIVCTKNYYVHKKPLRVVYLSHAKKRAGHISTAEAQPNLQLKYPSPLLPSAAECTVDDFRRRRRSCNPSAQIRPSATVLEPCRR
jgi:hypothetical protein